MIRPRFALGLALAATLLSACDAKTLAAVGAAANAAAGATPAPSAVQTARPDPTPAPIASASAAPGDEAGPATADLGAEATAALDAFGARVDARETDARQIAALFVEGLVVYGRDQVLGRAMMASTVMANELRASSASPTGYDFVASRDIYFRTIDRQPTIGEVYLDDPSSATAADIASHVVFADDYAAVDNTGVDEAAGTATFYVKVTGADKRPRPIRLKRVEGAWFVSEYNSLMVAL